MANFFFSFSEQDLEVENARVPKNERKKGEGIIKVREENMTGKLEPGKLGESGETMRVKEQRFAKCVHTKIDQSSTKLWEMKKRENLFNYTKLYYEINCISNENNHPV